MVRGFPEFGWFWWFLILFLLFGLWFGFLFGAVLVICAGLGILGMIIVLVLGISRNFSKFGVFWLICLFGVVLGLWVLWFVSFWTVLFCGLLTLIGFDFDVVTLMIWVVLLCLTWYNRDLADLCFG